MAPGGYKLLSALVWQKTFLWRCLEHGAPFEQDVLDGNTELGSSCHASLLPGCLMPTYLDIFAGAGGLSLGLEAAGFDCVGAVELDPRAAESYRLNFPGISRAPFVRLGSEGDVRQIRPALIRDALAGA